MALNFVAEGREPSGVAAEIELFIGSSPDGSRRSANSCCCCSTNREDPVLFHDVEKPLLKENGLGWHWLVDFFLCKNLPTECSQLESILVHAAELAGATVVQNCFHRFSPYGLSGVVVIAESHLAAHTWPEHQVMCIDLFSCSEKIKAKIAIDYIAEQIQAEITDQREIVRGRPVR